MTRIRVVYNLGCLPSFCGPASVSGILLKAAACQITTGEEEAIDSTIKKPRVPPFDGCRTNKPG